jgi:hypothetical protein
MVDLDVDGRIRLNGCEKNRIGGRRLDLSG